MAAYNINKSTKFWGARKILLLGITSLVLLGGIYLLFLVLSPRAASGFDLSKFRAIDPDAVELGDQQIIIPKIGVNIEFFKGREGVLEKGAWWRYPERGNPETGGNFILSAHRFRIGWTPQQTSKRSPFYNIHVLDVGDKIYVDYKKKRYEYTVTSKQTVKPDAV